MQGKTRLSGKCTHQLERSKRLVDIEDDSELLLQRHQVASGSIELLHLPCCPDEVPCKNPDHFSELADPPYRHDDLPIKPTQPALRLVEGLRPECYLPHKVGLNDVEVLSEALLQRVIVEWAGGLEGRSVFEREVLLEEERRHLSEAGGEARGGRGGALSVRGGKLRVGVEADVGEAREGVGDGGKVGCEVGAGDLAGVRRRRWSRIGQRDGGGWPGQPGVGKGGSGGEWIVEKRGDGLRDAAWGAGGGGGVGGG